MESLFEIPLDLGDGTERNCAVSVSPRAKYMRLKVDAEGNVSAVLPSGASRDSLEQFLLAQRPWLRRTLIKIRRKGGPVKKEFSGFPETVFFGFLSLHARVQYEFRDVSWTGCRLDTENALLVFTGNVLNRELVRESFGELLKRLGSAKFPLMLKELSERTGIPYRKCSVRLQTTRWGSCTLQGHISLNGQLLFFPPELAEYVMIHELCHLRHMNHSPEFWQEVSKYVPDWQIRRKNLQKSGKNLPETFRMI